MASSRSSASSRGPLAIRILGSAGAGLALSACIIDRGPVSGTTGVDAFVGRDTGALDAPIDAFVGPDVGRDAFVDIDAFEPIDVGLDAPPPIDAFSREDAFSPIDAGTDAFSPPDAFRVPDAFSPVDAFAGMDAFEPPDAFVAPDAFVPPDAFVVDAYVVPDAFVPPDAYSFSDLVAWYPFNGTTDASGHGHTLTATMVTFANPLATFVNNSRLNTPDAADLDEIVTVAFWARRTENRGMALACRMGSFALTTRNTGEMQCQMFGSAVLQSAVIPLDTWSHVACVYDGGPSGGTVTLFVDGSPVSSGTGTIVAGNQPLRIGEGCDDELRGDMTDVRFYRRALSSLEVSDLAARRP